MNKKQINMIVKVIMDNSSDNPYRRTIQKINKVGKNRLKGADKEDIEGYSYLLIIEYLNEVSMDYWNSLTDKKREKEMIYYCHNKFKKLSKSEGINIGIKCEYNKKAGKYEYYYLNHINIDDIELDNNNDEESINSSTLTDYIFSTYINDSYLTKYQLRYIYTVVNNYIDDGGNVRDIMTDEILYTKQASYKHKKSICNRLEPLIDKDLVINKYGRWTIL